jgi:hypothetical protein
MRHATSLPYDPISHVHCLCLAAITLIAAATLTGCSNPTEPTGTQGGSLEPGELRQLEGSLNWFTNSVSWLNENELGAVPEDRYAMITISQRAAQSGPSHFLFRTSANFNCNDQLCSPNGTPWSDPELVIHELDWSPVGGRLVCEGRERQGQMNGPAKVTIITADGANRHDWGRGLMPSFSRDGGRVVYVTPGKDVLRVINADTGEGGDLVVDMSGIEFPRFSPGDSLLAFSAQHYLGRRIFVADTRRPEYFPDVVSDPDDDNGQSRDGISDNFPTWSPNSRYLAYVATVTRGGTFRDKIFVTIPGSEPEMIAIMHTFEPGQRVSHLRWHPSGRRLLLVIDGNVYMLGVPERYRDLP